MLELFDVCGINHEIMRDARKLKIADYEDATQAATALAHGIEIIITRDKTFSISSLQTHSPSEFLALL